MPFLRFRTLGVPLLLLLLTGINIAQTDREKLLLLPFEVHALSNEESQLLTTRFADGLKESRRFDVILSNGLQTAEGAGDPASLARTGVSFNVQKVVQVSIMRRENLFVLQIRLVRVSDGSLLYAERVDYSGAFASLLSEAIPEQARRLTHAHLDAKIPWAKATFLFGACLGAIIWIYWHFRRRNPKPVQR